MVRRLLRHPVHLAVQVVSLGIGLAVCLSAFVALEALAFSPTPGISDRVHLMHVKWASSPASFTSGELKQGRATFDLVFEHLAVEGRSGSAAEGPAGPFTARLAFVSDYYFQALGTSPRAGRLLQLSDGDIPATPSVVISDELWQRAFGSQLIDGHQTLRIAGHEVTVVGIAPPGFPGLMPHELTRDDGMTVDVWLPLASAEAWRMAPNASTPWLLLAGKLAAGQTTGTAQAEISTAAASMARRGPVSRDPTIYVYPAGRSWSDDPLYASLTALLFLFIPFGILGIGCANTVNLQLARAHERAPELSIRLALGASRGRLVTLLAGDTVVVAVLSAVVAMTATQALVVASASTLQIPLRISMPAFVLIGLLAFAIVVAAGVVPAVFAMRGIGAPGRQAQTDGPRHQRIRYGLVGLQVAACTALLFVTMLGARSIASAITRPGPAAARTALYTVPMRDGRGAIVAVADVGRALLERLLFEPGVEGVGLADFGVEPRPISLFHADGRVPIRGAVGGAVSAGWFNAFGCSLLGGRELTDRDPAGVVVVNRALAKAIDGDGQIVLASGRLSIRVSVVGVIDAPGFRADVPMMFLPLAQGVSITRPITVVVRAESLALASQAIRRSMAAVAPAAPGDHVVSVAAAADAGGFAAIVDAGAIASAAAILMAAVGIFAMMTYTVEQRSKEIGIRLAIGASRAAIVRTVVTASARVFAIGVAVGLSVGVALGAALRSVLFVVSPLDPLAVAPAVGVLLLAAVGATLAPALAATRVDPLTALRD